MSKLLNLSYMVAKVKSKFFGYKCMAEYFRSHGVNIDDTTRCYSDIVSQEAYLITIKGDTTISYDVDIITHDNSLEKLRIGVSDSFGKVEIGENCFVGAHSIIMPGVTTGNNCIIGA